VRAESPSARVDTTAGALRGSWVEGTATFLGVPFAEAPIGERRFGAPERRRRWSGVRDATHHGATPQKAPLADVTTIPEPSIPGDDVLNLNVFTPAPGERNARLPVLVWIHGGGFIAGSPASPWYDGRSFSNGGIVTVVVSYRLGIEGFASMEGAPDNRGLLDILTALEWVADNIEDFGGDPAAVTVGGQSAGGSLAIALLGMPRARSLYRAVIAQSAPPSFATPEAHRRAGEESAALAGIRPSMDEWASRTTSELAHVERRMMAGPLQQPPHPLLWSLATALAEDVPARLPYSPVVDGELLTEHPWQVAAPDKRLLVGATADEFVLAQPTPLTLATTNSWLDTIGAPREIRDHAIDLLLGGEPDVFGRIMTDRSFRDPAPNLARHHADSGAPTWFYDFTWCGSNGLSSHCFDLPFSWGLPDAEGVSVSLGPVPRDLAIEMHAAWAAYVRGDDPTTPPRQAAGFQLQRI
jgi:para-nitrobenzyl esterase